ncbi:hypothetical protein ZWY2020_049349 [Hordeum vulgare]|nr:hypothetical protein ZWY2020_049349 [Hordeum vulgare]
MSSSPHRLQAEEEGTRATAPERRRRRCSLREAGLDDAMWRRAAPTMVPAFAARLRLSPCRPPASSLSAARQTSSPSLFALLLTIARIDETAASSSARWSFSSDISPVLRVNARFMDSSLARWDMSKFSDESFDCAPVPLAQFDDTQLLSYYNLLEDTSLVSESAHRLLGDFGGNFDRNFEGRPRAKLPSSLVALARPRSSAVSGSSSSPAA